MPEADQPFVDTLAACAPHRPVFRLRAATPGAPCLWDATRQRAGTETGERRDAAARTACLPFRTPRHAAAQRARAAGFPGTRAAAGGGRYKHHASPRSAQRTARCVARGALAAPLRFASRLQQRRTCCSTAPPRACARSCVRARGLAVVAYAFPLTYRAAAAACAVPGAVQGDGHGHGRFWPHCCEGLLLRMAPPTLATRKATTRLVRAGARTRRRAVRC